MITKKGKRKLLLPFDDLLLEQLQDKAVAVEYLKDALANDGMPGYLEALRQVAEARGGIARLAVRTKLTRQALYKILSRDGNPSMLNVLEISKVLGVKFEPVFLKAA
jgi:probable addiction module antidote protein